MASGVVRLAESEIMKNKKHGNPQQVSKEIGSKLKEKGVSRGRK